MRTRRHGSPRASPSPRPSRTDAPLAGRDLRRAAAGTSALLRDPRGRYEGSRSIPTRRCAMRKKVLVLGTNFAGLTAALAVQHELDGDVDVTVVSPDNMFLFTPSLIWLPFGKRDRGGHHLRRRADARGPRCRVRARRGDRRSTRWPTRHASTTARSSATTTSSLPPATATRRTWCPASPSTPSPSPPSAEAERTALAWQKFLDEPGRRGRRRHPGRRLLRRRLRVPVQHRLPAPQGRAAAST